MFALNKNTYNKRMQPDRFKLYALSVAVDACHSIYLTLSYDKTIVASHIRLGDNQNLELVHLGSHSELGQ